MSELVGNSEDRLAHLFSLLDCLTDFLKIEIKKIKLRSFKSSENMFMRKGMGHTAFSATNASSVTL